MFFFFLMIRRPPRSTPLYSSAASDVYKRQGLVNVGIIGLMKALEKFDSTRNVQFETYARFRIRGAVLDELRSRDWVPRSVRHKYSKLEEAFHALKKNLRRPPTEDEVANY